MGFQKRVKTKLLEESFTLPPDVPDLGRSERGTRYSLFITAKKYRVQELEAFRNDSDAITVLALHSTSFHKETWEPTLEALFQALVMHGSGKVKIREVWAVDCPNHGHAGVLNRDLLESKEFATDCGSLPIYYWSCSWPVRWLWALCGGNPSLLTQCAEKFRHWF